MHFSDATPSSPAPAREGAWWKELTGYQWFVFVVASLGWLFDTMDQQLFNLARVSAVRSLLRIQPGDTSQSGLIDRIRRLCDVDLHGRLGDRRDHLRHPRRQDRPREDHGR